MICFRLLDSDDPAEPLTHAVATVRAGETVDAVYAVDPASFRQVPNAPFAYWVSERIRALFTALPPFESDEKGRTAACGLGTLDDYRFLRLVWECPTTESDWTVYFDGGRYCRFWNTFVVRVTWAGEGREIKTFVEKKVGSASRKVQSESKYFKPGFVFPRRTRALSPKAMPSGGIFSTAGQAGFMKAEDIGWGIALLGATLTSALIAISQGSAQGGAQFEVGWLTSNSKLDCRATSVRPSN